MTLFATFQSLPQPSAPGRYSVESVADRWRVGRSYEGHPALLIAFARVDGAASVPRRLANITYAPPATVEVSRGGSTSRSERLAILECRTRDAELSAYFFRVVGAVLVDDERAADAEWFEGALDAVVSLFKALERPGARTVQGLWAELAVVAWSANPTTALSSWHSSPRALHDFSVSSARLEVKGTSRRLREHSFRLEQISALASGVTVIASVMLEEASDGMSVLDLVDAIRSRVGSGEPSRRLETVVAESLGAGWRDAGWLRFDGRAARESLRLYNATQIPTIPQPIPAEIKDVRFVVDLSSTPSLDLDAVKRLDSSFASLLPPENLI